MVAESYRVDIAFEVRSVRDPTRIGRAVEKFVRLLPPGSQTLVAESMDARPDGLARVAATVPAYGPAQALRDVARALELMAVELGEPDGVGPMRRTVVEYLGG